MVREPAGVLRTVLAPLPCRVSGLEARRSVLLRDGGRVTSSRKRGNELERRAQKELEADGFLTDRARPDLRWIGPGRCISKKTDLLGAFDVLAVDQTHIRFIQVCEDSGGHAAERRKKVEAIAGRFPGHVALELWRWRSEGRKKDGGHGRGWIKEWLSPAGWREFEFSGNVTEGGPGSATLDLGQDPSPPKVQAEGPGAGE